MSKIGRVVFDYENGTIEIWRENGKVNIYTWEFEYDVYLTNLVHGCWIKQLVTDDDTLELCRVIYTKGV